MYNSLPAPQFDVNFGMTTSCNSEWAGPRTEVVHWLVGDADTYFKSATLKKINAFYTHTYITVKPIKANSQNLDKSSVKVSITKQSLDVYTKKSELIKLVFIYRVFNHTILRQR